MGTVDVGGLDTAAARRKVAAAIGPAVGRPITLTHRSKRYVLYHDGGEARLDVAGLPAVALFAPPCVTVRTNLAAAGAFD